MTIVFYTSGHGFGHASRDLEVINAIGALAPQIRIAMRTAVPRWFIDACCQVPVDVEPVETDPGVAQLGSLAIDEAETGRRAAAFYTDFAARVADEVQVLERLKATLVVGDIPPLAFAAAAEAGVPSVALGNFTWDWIYGAYTSFDRMAPGVAALLRTAYATATLPLRLPFHGGFETMSNNLVDLPLVARRSRFDRLRARQLLNLAPDGLVVLASFGGHHVDLPLDSMGLEGGVVLVTDHELPHPPASPGNSPVRWFRRNDLNDRGIRYEDLVAASDIVVAKLGYGIVSECIANSAALLYTSRGRFREQEVFVEEMPRVLRCGYVSQEDLREKRWADAAKRLLAQPSPPDRMAVDGAEAAAAIILRTAYADRGTQNPGPNEGGYTPDSSRPGR